MSQATKLAGARWGLGSRGRPAGRRGAQEAGRTARVAPGAERPQRRLVVAGDRERARRQPAGRAQEACGGSPPRAEEVAVFERFTTQARSAVTLAQQEAANSDSRTSGRTSSCWGSSTSRQRPAAGPWLRSGSAPTMCARTSGVPTGSERRSPRRTRTRSGASASTSTRSGAGSRRPSVRARSSGRPRAVAALGGPHAPHAGVEEGARARAPRGYPPRSPSHRDRAPPARTGAGQGLFSGEAAGVPRRRQRTCSRRGASSDLGRRRPARSTASAPT